MQPTVSRWYDLNAYTLESDALRVVIVPERGAKIASLVDKRLGHEWLIQPTRPPAPEIPYAASYVEYDINAWDEMFPTIVSDSYAPAGAYHGAALPDHGEVWPLPWEAAVSEGGLHTSVSGRALPYRLERTARLETATRLRLDYRVTSLAEEALYLLWSPHALFAADEQTEIMLPAEVTSLYTAHDVPPWGAHGTRHAFPHPQTSDGKTWDLRRVGPPALRDCRKFYVPPELSVDHAGLRQRDTGAWLRLSWDAAALPYLGIWIDEGLYVTVTTIGLSPSNAFYDNVNRAIALGRVAPLGAGETRAWSLAVELGSA